ncbi:MAG: hypothetical protein KDB03_25595, partial [Planctomycetales bacterium]|nr:hypothetical protein [Planctomycetales bacterium]
ARVRPRSQVLSNGLPPSILTPCHADCGIVKLCVLCTDDWSVGKPTKPPLRLNGMQFSWSQLHFRSRWLPSRLVAVRHNGWHKRIRRAQFLHS